MRLIDAHLAQEIADKELSLIDAGTVQYVLSHTPTIDAEPVVRCKDCKYIRPEVDAYTHEVVGYWCSFLDLGSIQDEHFCSYGERKDGE